jgi:phosphocarrier protein HPr
MRKHMLKQEITICNKLGLHARAAMKLVNLAGRYESDVLLIHNNREVNAKSIMNLMVIGAPFGTKLTLSAEGPDEQQALAAVIALINNKFDEHE